MLHCGTACSLFAAVVLTASCSEKSDSVRTKMPQAEEVTAGDENRRNKSEVERSTTPRSDAEEEKELQPPEDEIGEDCVAFLRSTKTVPANGTNSDCPQCPATTEGTEVLKLDNIRVDRVVPSESSCEVNVTIHATFNPSTRETIAGGLTAWISPEQKAQYLQGQAPSGQQAYKVKVIYRRNPKGWRAIEFDRP